MKHFSNKAHLSPKRTVVPILRPIQGKALMFIFGALLMFSSCKKEDNDYGLPNATSEGKNTFACVVDGEAYIARNENKEFLVFGDIPLVAYYDKPAAVINTLDIRDVNGETKEKQINCSFYFDDNGQFKKMTMHYHNYELSNVGCNYFKHDTTLVSDVHITRFDPPGTHPRIVSGTFSCQLREVDCGNIIEVTDGRFDVKL